MSRPEPTDAPAAADEDPLVSVVVPVRDDVDGLRRCLHALARQDYPAARLEVMVVDNGSTAPVEQVTRQYPGVRLLAESVPGSYAARNRGIREARGDVIAFTDADCLPGPGWLRAGVRALTEDPAVGLVAGHIEVTVDDPRRPSAVAAYELLHAFPQEHYALRRGFAATANAFTRRDVLVRVGPFDPSLRSGGDKEWGGRVRSFGYSVTYCPDAVVRHPARTTVRQLHAKFVRVFEGERILRARTGGSLDSPRHLRWWRRSVVPPVGSITRAWTRSPLQGGRAKWAYTRGAVAARYVGAWVGLRAKSAARDAGAPHEGALHAT